MVSNNLKTLFQSIPYAGRNKDLCLFQKAMWRVVLTGKSIHHLRDSGTSSSDHLDGFIPRPLVSIALNLTF